MCKECGCGENGSVNRLQFNATGYNDDNAKSVEKTLLGLPGVMYVHIHAHDGETTIDYDPKKTKLIEIIGVFGKYGVEADI